MLVIGWCWRLCFREKRHRTPSNIQILTVFTLIRFAFAIEGFAFIRPLRLGIVLHPYMHAMSFGTGKLPLHHGFHKLGVLLAVVAALVVVAGLPCVLPRSIGRPAATVADDTVLGLGRVCANRLHHSRGSERYNWLILGTRSAQPELVFTVFQHLREITALVVPGVVLDEILLVGHKGTTTDVTISTTTNTTLYQQQQITVSSEQYRIAVHLLFLLCSMYVHCLDVEM